METTKLIEEWEDEYGGDPEFELYGLLYVITDEICRAMEEQKVSRAKLADRLGVSRQYITKFLNTPRNTTLESILRFANALGLGVGVTIAPRESKAVPACEWVAGLEVLGVQQWGAKHWHLTKTKPDFAEGANRKGVAV